jgi:hypothetical protein
MEVAPYILHVVPIEDAWKVVEGEGPPSLNVYATREEAERHAADLAEAAGYGEIRVYDPSGTIVDSYMWQPAA